MSNQMQKWERRKTVGIVTYFGLIAFGIPLIGFGVAWFYAYVFELIMTHRDWVNIVLCLWIGTLLCLVWAARSAVKDKVSVFEKPFSAPQESYTDGDSA